MQASWGTWMMAAMAITSLVLASCSSRSGGVPADPTAFLAKLETARAAQEDLFTTPYYPTLFFYVLSDDKSVIEYSFQKVVPALLASDCKDELSDVFILRVYERVGLDDVRKLSPADRLRLVYFLDFEQPVDWEDERPKIIAMGVPEKLP